MKRRGVESGGGRERGVTAVAAGLCVCAQNQSEDSNPFFGCKETAVGGLGT